MKNIYWSDFHSNMHHKHLDELDEWLSFAKEMLDFWAPVYYPYFVNCNEKGFHFEDTLPKEEYTADWEKLNNYLASHSTEKYPLYSGYEWQGDGSDGDHNVIFKDFDKPILMPVTYSQLCKQLPRKEVVAIPHHTGYQPGHRGKNWETNDEEISPVMEIYSSHGSSEASDATIPLNVHIHMGPRADEGTAQYALKKGIKTGFIASGDNHVCPAISGNGFVAVLCEDMTRENLFQAVLNRHTYGVSRNKIEVDFRINGAIMGSEIQTKKENVLQLNVNAGNAIDRIEFYRNGVIEDVYVHSGTWERKAAQEKVRFKFELELGWGPDRRVFSDIYEKIWNVKLQTKGEILSVEKLWTSPGSQIIKQRKRELEATILTRKEGQGSGKLSQKNYLTPYLQNQSMNIEIEDDIANDIKLTVNGKMQTISIKKLLDQAILFAEEEEVRQLLASECDFTSYYREDPWWHNAYKFLLHKASPQNAYQINLEKKLSPLELKEDSIFVKIIQKNGDVAWTSPIWIKREV